MRFETTSISFLAACASASDDTPTGSSNYHPPLASKKYSNPMSLSKIYTSEATDLAWNPVKPLLNNVPVTSTLEVDGGANGMDTIGTPDLGILETMFFKKSEMEGESSSPPKGTRRLGGHLNEPFTATIDCESYCAQHSRPVVEVSGEEFRAIVHSCIAGEGVCHIPLNCWNTSKVTDMRYAFEPPFGYDGEFNEPLNCWDVSRVSDMSSMFYYQSAFNQPINEWDVSRVDSMDFMFYYAYAFNQPINKWDVSRVTKMSGMFFFASSFNQPINEWDVSRVYDMSGMFGDASIFNQPINEWDVSRVRYMNGMFVYASSFNQPINEWDVSRVYDMNGMFDYASSFNQPINEWDVSRVDSMDFMFYYASAFNQPINKWDVSRVTNMSGMFFSASSFNQPINEWDVSRVYYMSQMFHKASSFNQPIDGWNVSRVDRMKKMFLKASAFNQCLAPWEALVSDRKVKKNKMFKKSGCESTSPPNGGVWCNSDCTCVDDGSFRLNGKRNRDCNWVAKNPGKRCGRKDKATQKLVKDICPMACNMRCLCQNSKESFESDGDAMECEDVKEKKQCKQDATSKVFQGSIVADLCPKKCGVCQCNEAALLLLV